MPVYFTYGVCFSLKTWYMQKYLGWVLQCGKTEMKLEK